MKKWKDISIQSKIRGFALFFLIIAGLYYVNEQFIVDEENGLEIRIGLLEARRSEKDFFNRKDIKYIKRVKEYATKAQQIAEKYNEELGVEIRKNTEQYLSNFIKASDAEIKLGLDEKSGIRGKFRDAVHKVESAIKATNNLQLEVDMLTIRRAEKDYIIRGAEKYIGKNKAAVSKLIENTNQSRLSNAKKLSIISLAKEYSDSFTKYVNIVNEKNKFIKTFSDYAHKLEPLIEEFGDKKHSSVETIKTVFIVSIILSIIVVILLSNMLGKGIMLRLKRVAEFAVDVENGNFDNYLTDEASDEIGTLSKALNKMTEKLQQQLEYLNQIPTPLTIMDNDFNVQYINKFGADLVGVDQSNLNGVKCYDLFNTTHCNTEKCAVAQAMKSSSIVTNETIAHPKGNEMDIMYTGAPIKDKSGNVIGGLEYVADISEMKEREKYLERSTETILGAMEKFANGDLTAQVTPEKEGDDISKLFNGFNTSVFNIKKMIEQVKEAVEATASASTQISSSAEEMAAGAQEQSAQTSEVAAAMEEMSRTVVETAANATTSAEASRSASEKANEGTAKLKASKEGMEQIVEATNTVGSNISSLAEKSDQIGEIAQVIDDIADQTNLLALNAAIEAARAGEQGRGFAVVADEVRKLAERTTKATKEIAETIKAIQVEAKEANSSMEEAGIAVKSGITLNDEVGIVLTDILESVEDVSQQINQVAAASEEQSATAEQVSSNIESINNVTNESAAVVQQIATASEDLNRLTENLSELIKQFNIESNNEQQLGNNRMLLE